MTSKLTPLLHLIVSIAPESKADDPDHLRPARRLLSFVFRGAEPLHRMRYVGVLQL
jgi:hypothetical protein